MSASQVGSRPGARVPATVGKHAHCCCVATAARSGIVRDRARARRSASARQGTRSTFAKEVSGARSLPRSTSQAGAAPEFAYSPVAARAQPLSLPRVGGSFAVEDLNDMLWAGGDTDSKTRARPGVVVGRGESVLDRRGRAEAGVDHRRAHARVVCAEGVGERVDATVDYLLKGLLAV